MKKRGLSGNVGVGVFMVSFVLLCLAFVTSSWLVSDKRFTGAKFDRLGLWTHCFRSLPDPLYPDIQKTYYSGCRWVYDPFTKGYSQIRGFLMPPFIIATQFFFTICFLLGLICFGMIMLFTLCCDQGEQRYVQLIKAIGFSTLAGGICGVLAVIIFGVKGNTEGWMPGHDNNFFGWSYVVAIVGSILMVIASILFLVEANVEKKKREYLKESQIRFQSQSQT